jgi:hypothetical protein
MLSNFLISLSSFPFMAWLSIDCPYYVLSSLVEQLKSLHFSFHKDCQYVTSCLVEVLPPSFLARINSVPHSSLNCVSYSCCSPTLSTQSWLNNHHASSPLLIGRDPTLIFQDPYSHLFTWIPLQAAKPRENQFIQISCWVPYSHILPWILNPPTVERSGY